MGNYSSCIGCLGSRRKSVSEEDDESRLLFDERDGANYGSFGQDSANFQGDAQETQREFEALQRVVANTSDNMVDVFEITSPTSGLRGIPGPYALGIPDERLARYQSLLLKLSPTVDNEMEAQIEEQQDDLESTVELQRKFLPDAASLSGPFVGNFADAAKAVS